MCKFVVYFIHIFFISPIISNDPLSNNNIDPNSETIAQRVSKIAEHYSNWALGKPENEQKQRISVPNGQQYEFKFIHPTQIQQPPRYYNKAPIKSFVHSVRVQPPPAPPIKPSIYPIPPSFPIPNDMVPHTTDMPFFTTPDPFVPTSTVIKHDIRRKPLTISSPTPPIYQQIPPPSTYPDQIPRLSAQQPYQYSLSPPRPSYHPDASQQQHHLTEQSQQQQQPSHQPPLLNQQPPPPPQQQQQPQQYYMPMKTQPMTFENPNFPRLIESTVPMPPKTEPLMFTSNSSSLPSHMNNNYPSLISQLLPTPTISEPIPYQQPPSIETSNTDEPTKNEVMSLASKKQKYGMPRMQGYGSNFYQPQMMCTSGWCGGECCDTRQQHGPPLTTTIQATALPGSNVPSHPLVLVVHPPSSASSSQCFPACQPQCHPQCVTRLQYIHDNNHYYNTIQEPMCRPDCMPGCHVDCLIIPPERIRCHNFHCQCAAGYVQCAAFTCCMRYPNMAAKMRSNREKIEKSSEEKTETINGSTEEDEIDGSFRRQYSPNYYKKINKSKFDMNMATPIPNFKPVYFPKTWRKKNPYTITISHGTTTTTTTQPPPPPPTTTTTTTTTTMAPTTTTTTTTQAPTTTTSTTTTTTAPPPPPPTTTTTTTTTTATPPTTTTTTTTTMQPSTTSSTNTPPTTTTRKSTIDYSSNSIIMNITPIYPDMVKTHKIPMIPAYEVWKIPDNKKKDIERTMMEEKNTVGDIRGRHVIRSENFLDVLSELAQVKLKEDITEDFSKAATFIEFMTDNIRKL